MFASQYKHPRLFCDQYCSTYKMRVMIFLKDWQENLRHMPWITLISSTHLCKMEWDEKRKGARSRIENATWWGKVPPHLSLSVGLQDQGLVLLRQAISLAKAIFLKTIPLVKPNLRLLRNAPKILSAMPCTFGSNNLRQVHYWLIKVHLVKLFISATFGQVLC